MDQHVDVCLLFSSDDLVGQECSKLGMKVCLNFDLVKGFYSTTPQDLFYLKEYLAQAKPTVMVSSPPCTDLSGWAHLNRYRSAKFAARYAKSKKLARVTAQVNERQLKRGRHFTDEHPLGSDKW